MLFSMLRLRSSSYSQSIITFIVVTVPFLVQALWARGVNAEGGGFDLPPMPIEANIAIIVALVLFAGLMAGLTLGLMSLDTIGLQIIMSSGGEKQKKWARRIYPVRRRGNLLLITLIICNVAINSLISILSADLTSGLYGFFISTVSITLFGEIIPQAICSRHGLRVGAYSVIFVYIAMIAVFPIAFPLSWILDRVLGEELGTVYSRQELKKLLEIHSINQHGDLTSEETNILTGALEFSTKSVDEIMVPINDVFMLEINQKLDMKTMETILDSGYSRIPVYSQAKEHVSGLLLFKDLVLLDPEDEIPVRTIMTFYGRNVLFVPPTMKLNVILAEMKTGKGHLACVTAKDGQSGSVGILTLEDVIEELIQDEIVDETDVFIDVKEKEPVADRKPSHVDRESLRKFKKNKDPIKGQLTNGEIDLLYKILCGLPEFDKNAISEPVLKKLIRQAGVYEVASKPPEPLVLYQEGKPLAGITLIVEGKIEIIENGKRTVEGTGSVLGLAVLSLPNHTSGFTATVIDYPFRSVRISTKRYYAALKSYQLERIASRGSFLVGREKLGVGRQMSEAYFQGLPGQGSAKTSTPLGNPTTTVAKNPGLQKFRTQYGPMHREKSMRTLAGMNRERSQYGQLGNSITKIGSNSAAAFRPPPMLSQPSVPHIPVSPGVSASSLASERKNQGSNASLLSNDRSIKFQ